MIPSDSAFNTTVFQALCACLELSPSSVEASARIRPFPNDPENPPAPSPATDVIYYGILPEQAPDAGYMTYTAEDPTASSAKPAVSSYLPCRLVLVCYGPLCLENALRIRSFLFLDGSGYPRCILRKAGIYPVPRPPVPSVTDEELGGLIRRRADLSVSLRVRDTLIHPDRRFAISAPPAVILNRS